MRVRLGVIAKNEGSVAKKRPVSVNIIDGKG